MKSTLKQNQKQSIAAKIPDDYDYMDSLSIDGWKWEFLRRNRQYIEAFLKLEKQVKDDFSKNEYNKASEIIKIASNFGLLIGRISQHPSPLENSMGFLIFKIPPYKKYLAMGNKYFGDSYHIVVIPRPETRYCDFIVRGKKTGLFFIPQFQNFEIYESFEDLQNKAIISCISLDDDKPEIQPPVDRTKDFFYIAVSKNADIAVLRKNLLKGVSAILKKHKENQRARENKWKYYLIVYDLKKRFFDEISYDEIATILIAAYPGEDPKNFTETRNINNWNEYATSLINGDSVINIQSKTKSPSK